MPRRSHAPERQQPVVMGKRPNCFAAGLNSGVRSQMNRAVALSAVLLGCASAAVSANSNGILSAEGPLPLKAEQAPELLKPCWGGGPIPEGELWLPTAVEVAALETRLEKHMATIKLGNRGTPAAGVQSRGQYVGFMRGEVKHIYASYVPARDFSWANGNAIIVCDGGPSFWGIVYNTATGQFSDLKVGGTR